MKLTAALFSLGLFHAAGAPAPVQVDIGKLLNARVVTTVSEGRVAPLRIDVDGAGGVATKGAAAALGIANEHTVPDDGRFEANASHPEVILPYARPGSDGNQVRRSPNGSDDEYSFGVPPGKYAQMFLFYTSGNAGPAPLHVVLTYRDGSFDERDLVVPDWYDTLKPDDKDCIYLAPNLAKFSKDNKVLEKDHHNIFGLDVHPAPDKVLTQIKVHKTHPMVVFWGATGQPVD